MKRKIKLAAATLAAASVFSLCSFTVSATDSVAALPAASERTGAVAFNRYELSVSKIYNKNAGAYASFRITYNGARLSSDARMINGVPYVALRSFINETTDMTVTYKSAAKTLNIRGTGLDMDVIDGSNVIYANGRYLFSMTPSVIMTNGRMYAPLNNVAKALGFNYSFSSSAGAVRSGKVKPITLRTLYTGYRE